VTVPWWEYYQHDWRGGVTVPWWEYYQHDWRYALPCDERLPVEVRAGLDPWLSELAPLHPEGANARLAAEWADAPGWLTPLTEVLCHGTGHALVGGGFRAYLWLSLTAADGPPDLAWFPRSWSRTPWSVDLDAGRAYLLHRQSAEEIARLEAEELLVDAALERWPEEQERAHGHESASPALDLHEDMDESEFDVHLSPPPGRALARSWADSVGLDADDPLVAFLGAFAGLRDSPPRTAGGFGFLEECGRVEKDYPFTALPKRVQAEWAGALSIFTARSNDRLLYLPGGPLAFVEFAAQELEVRWADLPEFVAFYADFLRRGCSPLDFYSARA